MRPDPIYPPLPLLCNAPGCTIVEADPDRVWPRKTSPMHVHYYWDRANAMHGLYAIYIILLAIIVHYIMAIVV